jgi:cyanophycinase
MVANRWGCLFGLLSLVLLLGTNAARGQSVQNPLGVTAGTTQTGALVICGGGRLREEVYQEFLRLAGGKQARIVHIPSAYGFDSMSHIRSAYGGWLNYDVASFDFLDAEDSDEADTDEFVEPLKQATGVWIGGGAQGRLANLYSGTKTETALKAVLARGGVVGGTSAGASIMSSTMIRYGTSSEAVCDKGFGLVQHCVIDQHFAQRNRLPRLLGVLEEHQAQLGLGIDEGTAVILRGNKLKVMGSARATVCVPHPNSKSVTIHRLSDGDEVNILVASAGKGMLAWDVKRP